MSLAEQVCVSLFSRTGRDQIRTQDSLLPGRPLWQCPKPCFELPLTRVAGALERHQAGTARGNGNSERALKDPGFWTPAAKG